MPFMEHQEFCLAAASRSLHHFSSMHPVVRLVQSQFCLLALGLGLPLFSPAQDWLFPRGNPEMTGAASTALHFPLELAWTFKTGTKRGHGVVATPVVKGGKVYIGGQSGRFYCLDLATGKEVWKVQQTGYSFEGNAAFVGDLVIAACGVESSGNGVVYAWNASNGKEVWKFAEVGEIHAGVSIWKGPDGKVRALVGSYDYKLYCVDALTGTKLWGYPASNKVNGTVAIFDGKTAFGSCDGNLYILDLLTGKEEKTIAVDSYIANNVAVDHGVLYVTHHGAKVEAFALVDGMRLWRFGEREFEFYAAPAVNSKWVVAGQRGKRVYGLDRAKGDARWVFKTQDDVDSSPLICADTHVIFGCNDGYFYALNLAKGEEVWRYEIGAPVKSSPTVAGDYILIGADDGSVYAFKNGKAK